MKYEVILIIRHIDWVNKKVQFALSNDDLLLTTSEFPRHIYENNSFISEILNKLLKLHTGFSIDYIPIKLLSYKDDGLWLDENCKRLGSFIYVCTIPEIHKDYPTKWIDTLKLHEVLQGNDNKLLREINLCSTF
mgnify:CR=1 FL=1